MSYLLAPESVSPSLPFLSSNQTSLSGVFPILGGPGTTTYSFMRLAQCPKQTRLFRRILNNLHKHEAVIRAPPNTGMGGFVSSNDDALTQNAGDGSVK